MVRPFPLEIAAGDFAFAVGHRLTGISLLAYLEFRVGLLDGCRLVGRVEQCQVTSALLASEEERAFAREGAMQSKRGAARSN